MELIKRPRRLRGSEAVRRLCRETRLSPDSLIYPIFVDEALTGKRAIDSLPERERQVIFLRYYKNLTQDRAARVLGVSQVQVSRIERKAVEHLRERLGE